MTSLQYLPRYGTLTAAEIYSAVGQALSWWESSEDRLSSLFSSLSADAPQRLESYAKATRNVRAQMLDKALRLNTSLFRDGELDRLTAALDGLKALVTRRNQISHGYCCYHSASEDGVPTVVGHFLVPAINESGPMLRPDNLNDAMTAVDIYNFITELRLHRGVVIDAAGIIMMRVQDDRAKAAGQSIHYGMGVDPWQKTF